MPTQMFRVLLVIEHPHQDSTDHDHHGRCRHDDGGGPTEGLAHKARRSTRFGWATRGTSIPPLEPHAAATLWALGDDGLGWSRRPEQTDLVPVSADPTGSNWTEAGQNPASAANWTLLSRPSKPVRSGNPRLGRFDSCAAPLSQKERSQRGRPHPLRRGEANGSLLRGLWSPSSAPACTCATSGGCRLSPDGSISAAEA